MRPGDAHRSSAPTTHWEQTPQVRRGLTTTRSPAMIPVTSPPVSTTSPAVSPPRMWGPDSRIRVPRTPARVNRSRRLIEVALHPDLDVVGADLRLWQVAVPERLDTAMLFDVNGLHVILIRRSRTDVDSTRPRIRSSPLCKDTICRTDLPPRPGQSAIARLVRTLTAVARPRPSGRRLSPRSTRPLRLRRRRRGRPPRSRRIAWARPPPRRSRAPSG